MPCLVEQPRVLDGNHRLVGKALLKRQFVVGKGREMVAENEERTDRLAFAPQRRACDGADARRARRHYRPVGHLGIDIVEIRNMDLPVLAEYRSGQVAASGTTLFLRHRGGDALGAGAEPDRKAPLVTVGDPDRNARSIKQPRRGLGDPLQRCRRVAGGVGDGAEDIGTGGLPLPGDSEFGS